MEQIIEKLFTDPLYMTVGLVLATMIALSIFKKLFKAVIILIVVFIGYVFYLQSTGKDPIKLEEVKEKIEEIKDMDRKDLKKASEKMIKKAKKKIEELN